MLFARGRPAVPLRRARSSSSSIPIGASPTRPESPTSLPELSVGSVFYHFIDARRRGPDRGRRLPRVASGVAAPNSRRSVTRSPRLIRTSSRSSCFGTVLAELFVRGARTCRSGTVAAEPGPETLTGRGHAKTRPAGALRRARRTGRGGPTRSSWPNRWAALRVVHVNSTREGGGVAEILESWSRSCGSWGWMPAGRSSRATTTSSPAPSPSTTRSRGRPCGFPSSLLRAYEEVNADNAERLRPILEDADVVFIHDPQPAPSPGLLSRTARASGSGAATSTLSHPYRPVWKLPAPVRGRLRRQHLLARRLRPAHAAPRVPHPAEHRSAEREEPAAAARRGAQGRRGVRHRSAPAPDAPGLAVRPVQGSLWSDPGLPPGQGFVPSLQLVLAGGSAADDPEGEPVLAGGARGRGRRSRHPRSFLGPLQRPDHQRPADGAPTSSCRSLSARVSASR